MIVTQEDFNLLPYNLINLPADGTFEDYVGEQEEVHLRKLLGNSFYDALVAGIALLPAVYESDVIYAIGAEVSYGTKIWSSSVNANMGQIPAVGAYWSQVINVSRLRWLKLVDGENYTENNFTYRWWGLRKMVKPLIYALWIADNNSTVSSTGRTSPAVENGTTVDSRVQHCKGWNRFRDLACGIESPLSCVFYRYNCCHYLSYKNSLFGYLYTKSADFSDIALAGYSDLASYVQHEFCDPGTKNIFDL